MDHPLGPGAIQLLRGELQFRLGRGYIAGRNRRTNFTDLGLDSRFHGPILGAAL